MTRKRLLWSLTILALVSVASSTMAGKGGGGKPPKDPPPAANPAIAFTEEGKFSTKYMSLADADGSNQTRILEAAANRPSWSHDASQLCFFSDVSGPGLYTINVDGTGLTLVMDTAASALSGRPVWSPAPAADGHYKIAFGRDSDIFFVNPDGSGLVNATNTPDVSEGRPSWSPDGSSLAVQSGEDVLVYTLSSAGTGVVGVPFNLTDEDDVPGGPLNDYTVRQPAWAKTQDKIVVTVEPGGGHMDDLWVIDMTGLSGPVFTQITDTPDTREQSASWSHDDLEFVYMGRERSKKRNQATTNFGAYTIASDGSGAALYILPDALSAAWRR